MRYFIVFLAILLSPCYLYAEGLSTLIEVGKAQADIAKEADEETNNFSNVKKGVEGGRLKSGQSKVDIRKQYGDPVIEFTKEQNGRETWIYKSAASSFFKGAKIYLYFDDNGILAEIKTAGSGK